MESQDRLVGGADVPEEKEEKELSQPTGEIIGETKVEVDEKTITVTDEVKTKNGRSTRTPGPCCTCMSGSTGYNYYFLQNNFLTKFNV